MTQSAAQLTHDPGASDGSHLSRQSFLRTAAGAGMAVGAISLLAACGQTAATPASSGASAAGSTSAAGTAAGASTAGSGAASASAGVARLQLPTYMPFKGPQPDLAGDTNGVESGYLTFPKNLVKSVTRAPASGGSVTGLVSIQSAPPPPMDQHQAWQALNKRLGLTLNINLVPDADFTTKFATVIAGGDIPDLLKMQDTTFQGEAQFSEASLADLGPFIGGDAVKDYPNLANFPSTTWLASAVGGRMYSVPYLSIGGVLNLAMFANQTRLDEAGVKQITTPDEFMAACKQLTKPQANQWALGTYNTMLFENNFIAAMFGAPYNWAESGGKLLRNIETPEYKAAIDFSRGLVAAGVTHPDAFTMTLVSIRTVFANGGIAMMPGTFSNYANYWSAVGGKFNMRTIAPVGPKSAKIPYFVRSGVSARIGIKKGTPDRVKQLLGVVDFLSAPFGSEENLLVNYGLPDVNFAFDKGGNPVATDRGKIEFAGSRAPWFYLGAAPSVIYNPQSTDVVKIMHQDEQTRLSGSIVRDPTYGLASDTYTKTGATLDQLVFDRLTAIIAGRSPMTDYDQLVKDWRSQGGDKVRGEFEAALAKRAG